MQFALQVEEGADLEKQPSSTIVRSPGPCPPASLGGYCQVCHLWYNECSHP